MAEYRWNQQEVAAGYDAGAPLVHPYYVAVQDAVLSALSDAEQLEYFRSVGLVRVRVGWQRDMWAVMIGERAE